jgi:hypothetical protein
VFPFANAAHGVGVAFISGANRRKNGRPQSRAAIAQPRTKSSYRPAAIACSE